MSAAWAIQQAVYSALTGDAALMALVTAVYDAVPQDAAFPYVTIGEDTAIAWDSKSFHGFESTLTLHAWSRYRGRKEAKEITGAIYSILHDKPLAIAGYDTVFCYLDMEESFLDADGLTRHSVTRFRLVTTKL